jgi:hypothetical protein
MRLLLSFVFLVFLPSMMLAQSETSTVDILENEVILGETTENLDQFRWIKRPLVIFADSPADPRYVEQMQYISERLADLKALDVVVLTDTDPSARAPLRQTFRPRGFMLVLVGKDGVIYLRKPLPQDVRELSRTIDKLPMRQQEIRERAGAS